ncbi:MAG: hypothetical protein NWE94_08000 [Candidatus Bathyarchaeota archaeon]|nr:hypothetical protein [Candidatus Bathyarchaeota archaeon]
MVADDILKVLYAPHKAFKKIIQEPKYLGPFVLLIIFVVAQLGSAYVIASKSYIEQTLPAVGQGDMWTQDSALWQASSGVVVSNNTLDYVNSTYYGKNSVQFSASNLSSIWLELKDFGQSVNCGVAGFKNVSFRIKVASPSAKPECVTLHLYSLSGSSFTRDLTSEFSASSGNVWSNITVQVGSGIGWTSSGAEAKWENITGIKLEFAWSSDQNVDLRVDGLFFRGIFMGPLEMYGVSYLASSALNAITPFLFQWLLLTGLIYVLIKGLKGNVVWKPLMVAVGFALVAVVVQAVILTGVYTTLPRISYPLEVLAGVSGEFQIAYQVILDSIATVSTISGYIQIAIYVWIVALGALIVRDITAQPVQNAPSFQQFGWMKSLLTSVASFLLTLLILSFVLGM